MRAPPIVGQDAPVTRQQPSSPLESLIDVVTELVGEVSSVMPRLVDRSREQLAIAIGLAERLPCFGGNGSNRPTGVEEEVPTLRLVETSAEPDPVGETVIVRTVPAPAKRANPKSVPSKSTATKSTATKSTATKSTATKSTATKRPASTSPARKSTTTRTTAASNSTTRKATPKPAAPRAAKAPTRGASAKTSPTRAAAAQAPSSVSAAIGAADRAIPDYDGLAASQVIPRLDSLSVSELEAIRVHEAANRSRRTILSRIAQIQAG